MMEKGIEKPVSDVSPILERHGLWETFDRLRRTRLPSSMLEHLTDLKEQMSIPFRPQCRAGSLFEVALQLEAHAGVRFAAFDPQLLETIRLGQLVPNESLPGQPKQETFDESNIMTTMAVWQPAWLEERQAAEFAPLLRARRRRFREREKRMQPKNAAVEP
ncbi:hypothetical protein CCYA_CCYA07G2107 [Cyanidiococcus yangmingshanensis]|nr:hypothetical protein CCYA_CCYA07G2107 [Cyanidiococcus yangmingshanensis]